MNLKMYYTKEEAISFSRSFLNKLYPKFQRSTFVYVDFNLNKEYDDIVQIQVFYSPKSGFYSTRFRTRDVIRHAFGKWDKLEFQLAKNKNNPLTPMFIFDFSLDYEEKKFDSIFAKVDDEVHILTKLFDLSNENFELLNQYYNLYKIESANYVLFDFGNYKKVNNFLNDLERITEKLDFILNPNKNLIINPNSLNFVNIDTGEYNYCMVCRNILEPTINSNLFELSKRFPARCEECLKQIYALDLYEKLSSDLFTGNTILLSELEDMWKEKELFNYNFKLLTDFKFLEPLSEDIYKLNLNEEINNKFASLLHPIIKESESKKGIFDILGLDDDSENSGDKYDDIKCKICGNDLDIDLDICQTCLDKRLSIKYIHQILEYVKPGTGFTKTSLISKGFDNIDLDIAISTLEDVNLLYYDSDDLIIIKKRSELNKFIEKYSDDPEDIIESEAKESPRQTIFESDLIDEKSLDKKVNLIDYQDYLDCSYDNISGKWILNLKQEGYAELKQSFKTPFYAKLTAVKYLSNKGLINLIPNLDKNDVNWDSIIDNALYIENRPDVEIDQNTSDDLDNSDKANPIYTSNSKNSWEPFNFGESEYNPDISQEFDNSESSVDNLPSDVVSGSNSSVDFEKLDLQINNNHSVLSVEKKNLENEELLDKTLNLNSYRYHCLLSEGNIVSYKNRGQVVATEKFDNSFDAKLAMVSFLEYIGQMKIIDNRVYSKDINLDTPIEKDSKAIDADALNSKQCAICGKSFAPNTKFSSSQKYCNECKEKYTPSERLVLQGIKKGIYTNEMAIKANDLLKEGNTKSRIANILKLKSGTLVEPLIKFLLPKELISHESKPTKDISSNVNVSSSTKSKKLKSCPICDKEITNPNATYCKDCSTKFDSYDRRALAGIKKGTYTKTLAKKMKKLRNQKMPYTAIARELNLPNSHTPIGGGIVKSVLKFYYTDNGNEIRESLMGIPKPIKSSCLVCGNEVEEGEKYCNNCKYTYTEAELLVKVGIKNGEYDKNLAKNIAILKQDGKTNDEISKELNLNNPSLIVPILNFLLDKEPLNEGIYEEPSNIVDEDSTDISPLNKDKNICKLCGEEFIPKSSNKSDLYCPKCKKKYTPVEITVLVGIKEGKYTKDLAKEIYLKQEKGLNNSKIAKELGISNALINPIVKCLLDEEDKNSLIADIEEDSNIEFSKQIFKERSGDEYNIILKGVISDSEYPTLLYIISLFKLTLNKLSCVKISDGDYDIYVDLNSSIAESTKILNQLSKIGFEAKN